MLILSRSPGETVQMQDILVTVVSVQSDYVEIRVDAGEHSRVYTLGKHERRELAPDIACVFVEQVGNRARMGIEHPSHVAPRRGEHGDE
jgi:sRNA-binding carbon storage regulator CsrA